MQPAGVVRWRLVALISSLACLGTTTALAFPEGPPDGVAGDPPLFFNCTLCHDSFAANSGVGSLELLGLPLEYTPGAQYDLTVRLADPGQVEWGFEVTALDPQIEAAGTFTLTDLVQTQLSDNPGTSPDYVKQTLAGVHAGTPNGPVTWSFRWTAPFSGPVTFYLAANAANASGDPSGDFIYTLTQSLTEPTVAVQAETWSAVKALYRPR